MSADASSASALDLEKGSRFTSETTNPFDLTLSFNVKSASTSRTRKNKRILSDITGYVKAGEVNWHPKDGL